MAEVEISYKGSNIATMNASGTKTLLTEAKYMEDDVTVTYTRPSTPSPTLITKTITENGTYDAEDDNADGYSEVTVNVSGGGGYTLKEELFGYTPAGDVVYVPDENIPRYGIRGKRGMTKLTLDFQNGYGFAQSNNNGYNIQYNDIPVYVIIGHDSGVTLPAYVLTGNGSSFILVCRGCRFAGSAVSQNAFRGNTGMTTLDFTFSSGNGFQNNAMNGDSNLKTVIIRSSSVMSISAAGVFSGTPFASNGSGGTLYVPADLISSYQGASNWSTILGYANNQIKSIESTHNDPTAPFDMTLYYADGTPISA